MAKFSLGLPDLSDSWSAFNTDTISAIAKRDELRVNLLAGIIGLLAGYAAIGFRSLIGLFQNAAMFQQLGWQLHDPATHVLGYGVFLALPLALLVSSLIWKHLAGEVRGAGVPEVIEAVMTNKGRIRKRVAVLKALASSITIACGGSVGREGPVVQIGSAFASKIGQWCQLSPMLLKTLVGCGAAGATAATFNTPIAGVIFAIEIIILELKTKSFVPLVVSSVVATVVSRYHLGDRPSFDIPAYQLNHPREMVFYLVLGILAGLVGVAMIKTIYKSELYIAKFNWPYWQKAIVAGLLIAAMGMAFPEVYGVSYEAMIASLRGELAIELMLGLVVLKVVATTLTLLGGGSGGLFAPSLFVGAMLGGSFGYLMMQLAPEYVSGYGSYALVGTAAVFSATSRATFTAIVMLFEMTLDYSIILPLMFVCVTANQVAWIITKDTMYSMKLRNKGILFATDIGVNALSITLVRDIMSTELDVVREGDKIGEAAAAFLPNHHPLVPIVSEDGRLVGIATRERLKEAAASHPERPVKAIATAPAYVVGPDDTAFRAAVRIDKSQEPRILVVDPATRKLVGIVSPSDLLHIAATS